MDLEREPDAATLVSDGAADAHLCRRDEVRAVYDGPDWVEGGLVDSSHNGPGDRTTGHRASKYLPAGHSIRRRSRTDARRRAIGVEERPWFANYFRFLFRRYLKSDSFTLNHFLLMAFAGSTASKWRGHCVLFSACE